MKGKINEAGRLFIKRGSFYKIQECPFKDEENPFCGDHCPLFNDTDLSNGLELCRVYYDNVEIEDERK